PLAARLAAAGKSVVLIERAALGGTCVNYGCTPTKTMIASARAAHMARTSARLGISAAQVQVDLAAVVERKNNIVQRWRDSIAQRLRAAGDRLRLVVGHARFAAADEVDVGGQRHRANLIVVNVGARPSVPPLRGLDAVPWLDNQRAMELRD